MIIALDHDETYTKDPELFDSFIELCKARKHIVVIVTYRKPEQKIDHSIEVFYTSGKPKAEYMREQCFEPDIWIDDWPELIGKTRWM